jgi:hypothetical protein
MGALSDRIGRKPIILGRVPAGGAHLLPDLPRPHALRQPGARAGAATAPVRVVADPAECSFQFNPVGTSKFTSSCDIAKAALVRRACPTPTSARRRARSRRWTSAARRSRLPRAARPTPRRAATRSPRRSPARSRPASYPAKADPARINKPMVVALLFVLVFYVTMVYGPIAAMLVEFFPTNIRYTSMSLPTTSATAGSAGFLPTTAFAIVAATGDMYSGLWYPIGFAVLTLIVGAIFVRETKHVDIRTNH